VKSLKFKDLECFFKDDLAPIGENSSRSSLNILGSFFYLSYDSFVRSIESLGVK
jgi:hypothetical protein